jgi:hypothetical protein
MRSLGPPELKRRIPPKNSSHSEKQTNFKFKAKVAFISGHIVISKTHVHVDQIAVFVSNKRDHLVVWHENYCFAFVCQIQSFESVAFLYYWIV